MTKTPQEIREELDKRRAESKGGGKDKWFSLGADSKVLIRVGRPWKKDGEFWKDVYYHGSFKDKVYCKKNDIDPETGKPKRCRVCDRVKELKTDRSTFGKKLWTLINQRSESLWNVLIVGKKKIDDEGRITPLRYVDNKYKIWRLSSKWRDMLMDIFADEDYKISAKSILGITHPKRGRLIKVRRTGKGRDDTSYTFTPEGFMTPISKSEEKREKIQETLNDLDAMVKGSSKEELIAFLAKAEKEAKRLARQEKEGKDDDKDDDDEEEETEVDVDEDGEDEDRPKKKKKSSDDDSDDEEEEEEGDEDDDSDSDIEKKYKRMKKKLKAKKASKSDDDEDDE